MVLLIDDVVAVDAVIVMVVQHWWLCLLSFGFYFLRVNCSADRQRLNITAQRGAPHKHRQQSFQRGALRHNSGGTPFLEIHDFDVRERGPLFLYLSMGPPVGAPLKRVLFRPQGRY